jgi:peptide/nickel transport system ATP-binding protein
VSKVAIHISEPLLEVRDLKVNYKTPDGVLTAVDAVSLSVAPGESLGIVGESGAGKSSMALALMRVLPNNATMEATAMELESLDILKTPENTFRRTVRWQKISMVFQAALESLNPVIKIGDQVTEPLIVHQGTPKNMAKAEVLRLFELVSLPAETFNRYPHELSGGLKQRVLIAMSLVLRPRLLILDEPTSALDVTIQAQIMDQLKDLKKHLNLSIIFVTHDIALASDICDQLAVMYAGRIVETGPTTSILNSPQHPYTQMLLASMPLIKENIEPQFIPGDPPSFLHPPKGCRFHPRCPYVFEKCTSDEPSLINIPKHGQVKCWLFETKQ